MVDLIDLKELQGKVILIAVSTKEGGHTEASLDEPEKLAVTAGTVTIAGVTQNRERVHPGTYLGKGKINEVRDLVWELGATGAVCGDELSPAQLRNLEDALDTKVMDRTMVILDILVTRANTREGKIQMGLAQLKYRAVRLVGMHNSLLRLGGGTGTRGPGEKKPETDRRLIHQRIGQLKEELEGIKRHGEVTRQQREKDFALIIAIMGYTDAGESTLLGRLTGAGISAEDKLFATLDPATKNFYLEGGQQILLADTMDFIRKLPHHLIEAFKSTLEETRYSDIIPHVVDCVNPQMDMQVYVVKGTLRELETVDKTVVAVFNKTNRFRKMGSEEQPLQQVPRDFSSDYQVRISAKAGEGLDELEKVFLTIIRSRRILLEEAYTHSQARRVQTVRKYGQLLEGGYRSDGITARAYVPTELSAELYSDWIPGSHFQDAPHGRPCAAKTGGIRPCGDLTKQLQIQVIRHNI